MTGRTLDFTVHGRPIAQGNMVANKRGHLYEKNASVLAGWRDAVLLAGQGVWGEAPDRMSPFTATLDFYFVRPAGHYGKGRNAQRVLPSAPEFMTTRPDVDKLARSVLDALTNVVWGDDSQVIALTTSKDFGDTYKCHIRLRQVQ